MVCGPSVVIATILKINIPNKTNLLLLIIFAFQYKFYLRENWLFFSSFNEIVIGFDWGVIGFTWGHFWQVFGM